VHVEEIVSRLWPGLQAAIEPLGGGITNENYRVTVGGEAYVVRIGGKDTQLLGIDRAVEHAATLAAAAAGVGPDVVAYLEAEGSLVTRFIAGRPIPPAEMRRPEMIRCAAAALRRFYDGPAIPGRFDAFRIVEAYHDTAVVHGVRIPAAYGRASELAGEIERARGPQPIRPCHNDLLNANFIDDGRAVRIVDWEYAGMGDIFFDLANFSINHEFRDEHDGILLEAYFPEAKSSDAASLRLVRFMSDFREAMWGVVQQGISQLDFDFVAYAEEHFARLERTAADPGFADALARTLPPVSTGPPDA